MQVNLVHKFCSGVRIVLLAAALISLVLIFDRSLAQTGPWVAPADADKMNSPVEGNPAVLAEAKTLYTANCSPCHGDKGRGDGAAAPGLNPKPADHTSEAVQKQTDGAIFWKLSEGRAPMPGYKKIFTDQQRWELVAYIRTLAKGGKKK
jgi:mono/diheme cytochrome c family protein